MDPIALTRKLCAVESTTGQEGPVADVVALLLEQTGWRVTRQPVRDGRFNVYAHRGAPEIVFSTHLDTVPPYIPPTEDDEWLRGRGTCDAKGIAAAMITAAEQMVAEGERRVALLFLIGEEDGSDGAHASGALSPKGRVLINGEPTENRLTIGQKGVLRVALRATGRAAHSAYPSEGASAIAALLDTLGHVRALPLPVHPVLGDTTVNLGRIEGGVAPNVIAPRAEAQLLYRTVADTGALRAAIVGCAAAGVDVDFPLEIPWVLSEPLPGWEASIVSFASDLPFLAEWGERWQLGPGSIRLAHTMEEGIRKAELLQGVELYIKLARQLLIRRDA